MPRSRPRPRLSARAFAALRLFVACLALLLAASPAAREGTIEGGAGTWLIDPIAWVAVASPSRVAVEAAARAPSAPEPACSTPSSVTDEARAAAPRPCPRYLELCRLLL